MNSHRFLEKTVACFGLLSLTACAPTVVNTALPIHGGQGGNAGTMQLTLTENTPFLGATTIIAQAVANDGEIFNGKVTLLNSVQTDNNTGFGFSTGGKGKNQRDYDVGFGGSTTQNSSGRAVLIGNKGHSMTCELNLADVQSGIGGGGVGTCALSDGRTIPVTF